MKKIYTLAFFCFVCVTSLVAQSLTLRLMSFNVQQPFGTNWDGRRANAVTMLNEQQADVVGTQEAVNYQRDYLIANTAGYSWYGTGRDGGDTGEGCWIFYKTAKYTLDASNSGSFWLSNSPETPSAFEGPYNRICTYVRLVDKATGQGFYVYNAHFPTPDLYNGRLQSMQLMVARAASRAVTSDPVYFTGDFNSSEGDGVTLWMKSGNDNPIPCRDTYRDIDPTGSVNTGFGTKFDYVYSPAQPDYITTNAWVVNSPAGVSDHFPIVADLQYGGEITPHAIPGKIEAEAYMTMSGVQLEATTDDNEGQNIGFLEVDDWFEYQVDIQEATTYAIDLRTASETTGGELEIHVDGGLQKTVVLPVTGGWQTWQTTRTTLELPSGEHAIRYVVKEAGVNVNWMDYSVSQQGGGDTFQVKALAVNLWRKSNDWNTRMANVVSLIEGETPDIIGIQEGDEGKQAELASAVAGYTLETGPWNDGSTSFLYNSSSVSVVETGTFGYSSEPDNPNVRDWGDGAVHGWLRVCNWAVFELTATGDRFYAYNTHLDADGFTANAAYWRSQEVRLIAERIAGRTHQDYPFILLGDLNAPENEEAITFLKGSVDNQVPMVDTYREILPDGPGDSFGSVKLDYIMVADAVNVTTQSAAIIYHSQYGWTSDHQQVVATIAFGEGGNAAPSISNITHLPTAVTPDDDVTISATVIDDQEVTSVKVFWGTASGDLTNELMMSSAGGDVYEAIIPPQSNGSSIYYEVVALDNEGAERTSAEYSYLVTDGQGILLADYDVIDLLFEGFSGNTFEEVNNPDPSGINTSGKVGVTTQGFETWSGMFSTSFASPVDFSQNPIFSMKVYGPKTGEILVKFENSANTDQYDELTYTMTQVDAWEQVNIDFSGATSGVYDRVVLFFDFGNAAQDTYYFDDLLLGTSIITSTSADEGKTAIHCFPNPTTDRVKFSTWGNYEVFNQDGHHLQSIEGKEIDLTLFEPGVYFVRSGAQMIRVIKI